MTKYLFKLVVGLALFGLMVGKVAAADSLSVQIEQPKSPTNQNSFDITFVAMDIQGRAITAKCFKKSPSDAGFSQFGSDISLTAGGNSGSCSVTSSVLSGDGTYNFYVSTAAGSDSVDSSTVSVTYNGSGPSTPVSYSKEQSSCNYTIKFKTADDGKTSKVKIYRSDQKSFTADSGTEVGTVNIGPNLEGSFTNVAPDCSKTYYFAIRAFDDAGNGSGVIGDSFTTKVTTTVAASPTASGVSAIPVTQSQVTGGSVLGETSETTGEEILGEATPAAQAEVSPSPEVQATPETGKGWLSLRNVIIALLAVSVLFYIYRRYKKA